GPTDVVGGVRRRWACGQTGTGDSRRPGCVLVRGTAPRAGGDSRPARLAANEQARPCADQEDGEAASGEAGPTRSSSVDEGGDHVAEGRCGDVRPSRARERGEGRKAARPAGTPGGQEVRSGRIPRFAEGSGAGAGPGDDRVPGRRRDSTRPPARLGDEELRGCRDRLLRLPERLRR